MRYEFTGSLILHAGAVSIAVGLVSFAPHDQPPALESVSVDIITTHTFSTNETENVPDTALISSLSAGGPEIEENQAIPLEAQPFKPITQPIGAILEQVESESLKPQPEPSRKTLVASDVINPIPANEVKIASVQPEKPDVLKAQQQSGPVVLAAQKNMFEPQTQSAPIPVAIAAIKPVPINPADNNQIEAVDVPIPMPRIKDRPGEPSKADKPRTTSKPMSKVTHKKKSQEKKQKRAINTASRGNGGNSGTDSRAGAARSSSAVSNYPGKVMSKLRRSRRSFNGARGEVHVQFSVAGDGRATSIRVKRSSGNARLDAAAIATVKRASPFPPIPADAKRSSWTFRLPITFGR